jgi:hypothetical protein
LATKKRKKGALYFTSICRVDADAAALLGNYYSLENSDEKRIALLSLKKGVWGGLDLSGIGHAVRCAGGDKAREYLVLERDKGLYRIKPPADMKFDRVLPERRGFLMDLRSIDGSWYAVGGHRQVCRLDPDGWKAIDKGIHLPGDEGEAKLLLSISGTSPTNIFVAGYDGFVAHYDGRRWTQLDCPTNVGLQRILCVGPDVYACGHANTVMCLSNGVWRRFTEPDPSVIFWDMVHFQGRVLVCTKKALFEIAGDGLREVTVPKKHHPVAFYRMDAGEDVLWTCGDETVLQFDGKNWKKHVFPDNA